MTVTLSPVAPYLSSLDGLLNTSHSGDESYTEPALKNLGSIAIPIVREVISPASFRNEDAEVTDIAVANVRRIRAVANKFKFGERSRGLQVLRYFGAGGAMAQNKTMFGKDSLPSTGFDLNTIVFGDSANRGSDVLPVKAGVQYSDAISIGGYAEAVSETFHNRSSEDGTLWDSETKKNSTNLFSRHFILPGTLLVQVLTLNGKVLPPEALEHLLLSVGLAGAYGGQTSIYGINVKNHIVGVFGAAFERPIASPYEAVKSVPQGANADEAVQSLEQVFGCEYAVSIGSQEVAALQKDLIDKVEASDPGLRERYVGGQVKIGAFFDSWFGLGADKKKRGKK
jgi:hypothetical protein